MRDKTSRHKGSGCRGREKKPSLQSACRQSPPSGKARLIIFMNGAKPRPIASCLDFSNEPASCLSEGHGKTEPVLTPSAPGHIKPLSNDTCSESHHSIMHVSLMQPWHVNHSNTIIDTTGSKRHLEFILYYCLLYKHYNIIYYIIKSVISLLYYYNIIYIYWPWQEIWVYIKTEL